MHKRIQSMGKDSCGQSLIETALTMPVILMLILNAMNFGYYFLVTVNLTGASRNATEFAIIGGATPSSAQLPPSGSTSSLNSVSYLTYADLTGAVWNPAGASVQVCSPININSSGTGINISGGKAYANCTTCSSSQTNCGTTPATVNTGSPTPDYDPEPNFVLNRVDIVYKFSPLIPGTPFNIATLASTICTSSGNTVTCTFRRTVEMRAMN